MAALSAQRWQEVAPHLDRALDLAGAERATWLATIRAQDPALADDLQSLLDEHHALAGSGFLVRSPVLVPDEPAKLADPFGLVGQTLEGRFRVERQVAEGGFGIVYRAQQLVLDRAVALKVLKTPADMTAAQRTTFHSTFEEEGRTIARLKHPNIVDVHDFGVTERGQAGPLLWMALEWLEGKTLEGELAERAAGRPMTPAEALALLRPVLQTIGYAHRQQVVHRDLKPANILLAERDGAVTTKVLDFGIAKIMAGADEEARPDGSHTTKGPRAFSPDYAAPEQISYGRTGPWTDVHALGLILTRMLTGRRPYDGIHSDLFAAALAERRPSPAAVGHPAGPWEPVLARAMALRPADRYQSADELLEALEKNASAVASAPAKLAEEVAPVRPRRRRPSSVWALGTAALLALTALGSWLALSSHRRTGEPSGRILMAVLPFENLTGDPQQEYLSDGLTDGMIGQLGRLAPERLAVIARTSMTRYKGSKKTIQEIGGELGVSHLLEASVKRSENRVRVDARLIQVSDQTEIWSDSYDREVKDVLALQSEVAQAIASGVRLKLTPRQAAGASRRRSVHPAAYEANLKADYFLARPRAEQGPALGFYEQAIKLDPGYAPAHRGRAQALIFRHYTGANRQPDDGVNARTAALRALALDDEVPGGHGTLADVLLNHDWDWPAAEREYRRAIDLDPNDARAHAAYARVLQSTGRFDQAIAERKRAAGLAPFGLDPGMLLSRGAVAASYYMARRYDEALAELRPVIELEPNSGVGHLFLGCIYARKGRYQEALVEGEKCGGASAACLSRVTGYTYGRMGRTDDALKVLEQMKALARTRFMDALEFARVHAGLGQRDQAFAYLDQAYRQRNVDLIFLRIDEQWDPIRDDPRFEALAERIGIPPLAGGG